MSSTGVIILGVLLLLTACNDTKDPQGNPPTQNEEQVEGEKPAQPEEEEQSMEGMPPTALEAATTVMRILKVGDMEMLAAWAHPEKGVRYSPYAYVDKEKDLVFSRDEMKDLMEDSTVYEWRTFPGSGELIQLTYADYHKQFVYDEDFMNEAEISLNERLGEGTTLNNLNEVYPRDNHEFVEYYIDGFDPSYEGMDWCSLILVFEKMGYDHALVGIIHDQWTP